MANPSDKELLKQLIELEKLRRGINAEQLSDQQDIANVIKDQVRQLKFQNEEKRLLRNLTTDITRIAEKAYSTQRSQLGISKTEVDLVKQNKQLKADILKLGQQQTAMEKLRTQVGDDLARSIKMQRKEAQKLSNSLEVMVDHSKQISNSFGVRSFSGLDNLTKKIPVLSRLSQPFEDAAEAAREAGRDSMENIFEQRKAKFQELRASGMSMAKALEGADLSMAELRSGMVRSGRVTGTMAAGMKTFAKSALKSFGPISIIAGLLIEIGKAFMAVDKRAGETAKSMGISHSEALGFEKAMGHASRNMRRNRDHGEALTLTIENMHKAQMELNNLTGTSMRFSDEMSADFHIIQERLQLSGEAMGFFANEAMRSNKGIKEQLSGINDVVMQMNQQTGLSLSFKEIQEGVAKTSKANFLTQKMNSKEIARQIFLQKTLGLSASQLEQTQDSLLNFESSIGAEMEAELLTGRQLNLERARAAALTGDQASLAEELASQLGTAEEFGKMNVIQQGALAKAFGMSREELAGTLMEHEKMQMLSRAGYDSMSVAQDKYNSLIEDGLGPTEALARLQKDGLNEALANQIASLSAQEEFNAALANMKNVFADIAPQLVAVAKMLTQLLSKGLSKLAKFGFIDLVLPEEKKTNDSEATKDNYIPGSPQVALATGGIVTKPTTALIGEGGEPEAVIPLSKANQVGFGDNTETNRLLKELVAAVKQGGHVYIDGNKVGQSMVLATSKMG